MKLTSGYLDSFDYFQNLFLFVLSLIVTITSIIVIEVVIFIFYNPLAIKIILFYIPILLILSILSLISLVFLISVFAKYDEGVNE